MSTAAHDSRCAPPAIRGTRASRIVRAARASYVAAALLAAATAAPARDLVVPGPVAALSSPARTRSLEVPVIAQARQRCGPAALQMVLGYYGADAAALGEAERAFDPVLRGTLITELASAARRAGFDAQVVSLTPDSLVALLDEGVPAILLYQNGRPPFTKRHYGVVTGWDPERERFMLNDGRERPVGQGRAELLRRWRPSGSQALVVRPRQP